MQVPNYNCNYKCKWDYCTDLKLFKLVCDKGRCQKVDVNKKLNSLSLGGEGDETLI